jgi:mannose-1-phosphate guanylyltransferase
VSDSVPKPALPLLDIPLGALALPALCHACPQVLVNVSHLPEAVVAALAPWCSLGCCDVLRETPEPYGTGGTLAAVRSRIGERVVTRNSDVVTDLEPETLLESHLTLGALGTVAVSSSRDRADFEVDGRRVTSVLDRRSPAAVPGPAFAGMAVFERAALDLLSDRRPVGLTEALLEPLAERGELALHRHEGYWLDVGTPSRYLEASLDATGGRAPLPPGGRWPGELIDVAGGRAYVGGGTIVEEASIGPGAVLQQGCRIGPGATVRNSAVGPGASVPAGAHLDEVLWWGEGPAIPGQQLT